LKAANHRSRKPPELLTSDICLHTSPLPRPIFPGAFLRFQIVGVLGAGVHLGVLFLALHVGQLHYLASTILAVESALIHNFAWHLRWTWPDRPTLSAKGLSRRLVRFHCANGLVSVIGNAVLMRVLVGELHLSGLPAGGIAIMACSLLNYVLGDRFVFRTPG